MAKALQCPDCRTRHPLGDVAHLRTFRCRACRRLLKVPPSERAHPADEPAQKFRAPPSSRSRDRAAGASAGSAGVSGESGSAGEGVAGAARVPWPVRVGVWILAVPAGAVPVLVAGRIAGVLTMDHAVDVFVGVGWGRFVPPLLVLPVWAAASATAAHLAIEAVARNRGRNRDRNR